MYSVTFVLYNLCFRPDSGDHHPPKHEEAGGWPSPRCQAAAGCSCSCQAFQVHFLYPQVSFIVSFVISLMSFFSYYFHFPFLYFLPFFSISFFVFSTTSFCFIFWFYLVVSTRLLVKSKLDLVSGNQRCVICFTHLYLVYPVFRIRLIVYGSGPGS